ncbi:HAD-IA family hydrolase [Leptolyngbya boryana CZ1]|uniref:HAD-IA family hydrolase n=1 Tax=Leptolyngbya boryana CZ1 TaxID=3060204 RepID=A0AA96WWA1_LEPBY|nr:HAD-IA family hydrolase [Leptolyngbya boryana]WNZ45364.1 HAD-IA family hydrolase [Leptolyngbya boryana CZ1]
MKVILFDFDGTIVDSVEVGIAITNRLAAEFRFPPFDEETLEELKQLGSREALRRSRIPVWKLPFLIRRFTQELNREISSLQLFPEMRETLLHLKEHGHLLGIVSTNSVRNIQEFLRIQELTSTFDFVSASYALFGKSRLILKILHQHQFHPSQVYYVGDETRDIEAARKSGVCAIAATWGLNSTEILQANHPDFLIQSPQELVPLIVDRF